MFRPLHLKFRLRWPLGADPGHTPTLKTHWSSNAEILATIESSLDPFVVSADVSGQHRMMPLYTSYFKARPQLSTNLVVARIVFIRIFIENKSSFSILQVLSTDFGGEIITFHLPVTSQAQFGGASM
jgi:hypothetical protein